MFPKTLYRWGLGLAAVMFAAVSSPAADYQIDTWQFTPSLDTEYKVDIYGVIPATPAKPHDTWILLHDDRPWTYAGYVPEYDCHRWQLTIGGASPGIVGVCGNVYCRTNGCDWQSAGQICGQSQPGLMESSTGEKAVASAIGPANATESEELGDWLPMRLVSLAELPR